MASVPRIAPSQTPGFARASASAAQALAIASARSSSLRDIHADDRGGNQPEEGERRVAPTDVGWIAEDGAEVDALRQIVELGPGVGDRDEVLARARPPAQLATFS